MKKAILWSICTLFVILLVLIALTPTWISSDFGRKTILKWINQNVEGHLSIEKVELSWFGKQRLKELTFKDQNDDVILSFDRFETNTSLLYLLFGGRSLNQTELIEPYLFWKQEEKVEKEPPSEKVEPKDKKKGRWELPTFKDKLYVENGMLILSSKNIAPISISDIYIEKQPKLDLYIIKANTLQGEVKGSVDLQISLLEKVSGIAKITDFPIAVFDQLQQTSLFTEALGPTLNLNLSFVKDLDNSIEINGEIKSENLTATIDGVTRENKFYLSPDTRLEFTITPTFFHDLLDKSERGEWSLASKTKLTIQVEKGIFPLDLKKPDFHHIVLQASGHIERAEIVHKTLGNYSLNTFDFSIIALENLEITYQGEIQGKEATKFDGSFSITPDGKILYKYTYKGFPVSLLELFSVQAAKNVRYLLGSQFDMTSEGTWENGHVEGDFSITSTEMNLEGEIKGKYPDLSFTINGARVIHGEKTKVLGSFIYFSLNGIFDLKNQEFSIPMVSGTIYNPYMEIDLRGSLGEEGHPFSLESVQLIATGVIKEFPIEKELPTSLKNVSLFIHFDGSKNTIFGKLEAKNEKANIEIRNFIQEDEVNFDQADISFECNLQNFPLVVLNPFIFAKIDLTTFLGELVTIDAKGNYSPHKDPRFTIELKAKGKGFETALSMAIDGTLTISQDKPAYIHWEMTPERYLALLQILHPTQEHEPIFTLTNTASVDLNISQLTCPAIPPKEVEVFLCHIGFGGELHIGTMVFRSRETGESIVIKDVSGTIEGENFSETIQLALSGGILAPNVPHPEQSAFSFSGKMLNFWTPTGEFNREQFTVTGELDLDFLPVRQLTEIVPLDTKTRATIQAVLGELVNARIYGQISQLTGPVTIDVKASNFKTKLSLQLYPNAIYLRDIVDAEITLTEAVSETLLTDINPLLITGAYSDHPIKVYIEPKDFVIPIRPFSLEGVQIEKAIIDIGKIRVRNGGQIAALMQFLKAKEVSPEGIMQAWFTPIFMNLKGGVATYKRFDALLAENIHIALWGSVNLINSQVNMTLAIAPATLQQRFEILGLTKKDMFQVKMRGTTDNLELDWSSATTRIGFIIARTAGGHIGYIVGGILEQLVKAFGEEPTPSPTTDPLPWESQYPSEPGESIPQEAQPKKNGKKGFRKMMEFLIP